MTTRKVREKAFGRWLTVDDSTGDIFRSDGTLYGNYRQSSDLSRFEPPVLQNSLPSQSGRAGFVYSNREAASQGYQPSNVQGMGPAPPPPPPPPPPVDPKVKEAVDKVLDAWGTANSKGSGQRVIRDATDIADSVPVDTSKATDQERLGYAMKVLEGFREASPYFSKKAFGSWESAVLPFTKVHEPASKVYSEWVPDYYTDPNEGGVSMPGGPVNYSRWTQIAPQLGFSKSPYVFVGFDPSEGGGEIYGVSPEFVQFVDQKRAEGYDFVSKRSNFHNYNNMYGFKLPSGEIVGQTKTGDDDDVKAFFTEFVIPVATTVIGLPVYGGEAIKSLGSAILPAETAAQIGSALGISADAVTTAVGRGVVNAGLTAVTGGDVGDVARAGALPLAGAGVSNVVGNIVPDALGPLEKAAERAITSGVMGELSGKKDFGDAVVGSLTGSAIGAASETLGLPQSVVRGALDIATTGKVDPIGALTAASDLARQAATDRQIERAYSDPSRALDVIQGTRAQADADAIGEGGDVFGEDFADYATGDNSIAAEFDAGVSPIGGGEVMLSPSFSGTIAEKRAQVAEFLRSQVNLGTPGFSVDSEGNYRIDAPSRQELLIISPSGELISNPALLLSRDTTEAGVDEFIDSLIGGDIYPEATLLPKGNEVPYVGLVGWGQSANPPTSGGQVVLGDTSGSAQGDAIPISLITRDDGSGAGATDGFSVFMYSDGTTRAVPDDGSRVVMLDRVDPAQDPSMTLEQATRALEAINPPVNLPSSGVDTSTDYGQSVFEEIDRTLAEQERQRAEADREYERLAEIEAQEAAVRAEQEREFQRQEAEREQERLAEQEARETAVREAQRVADEAAAREAQEAQRRADEEAARQAEVAQQQEFQRQEAEREYARMAEQEAIETAGREAQRVADEAAEFQRQEAEREYVRLAEQEAQEAGVRAAEAAQKTAGAAGQTGGDQTPGAGAGAAPGGVYAPTAAGGVGDDYLYTTTSGGQGITPGAGGGAGAMVDVGAGTTAGTGAGTGATIGTDTGAGLGTGAGTGAGTAGAGMSQSDLDAAIARAGVVTRSDLDQAMAGITIPPGINRGDVEAAISDYMRQNPGLSPEDVSREVGRQLSTLPTYATPGDVEAAIRGALTGYATSADVSRQGEATQTAISGVEQRLGGRIDELMQQGLDRQAATDRALSELGTGLSDLEAQQAQQGQATQTAITGVEDRLGQRIDALVQQGMTYQDATNQALGELGGTVSGIAEKLAQESEARRAAEAEAKRQAELELEQRQQQNMLSLGSSMMSKPSAAVDPYKATFLAPFIVGGEAPKEFLGPLSGFLQGAMKGDFLPTRPQERPEEKKPLEAEDFFKGTFAYSPQAPNPLEAYKPEDEYTGLFNFRSGGLVPLMAQGGTRYGDNAHGALRVLEHSGKHRVDYRQGDAVTGVGDGQSDDIPAMLADGEFVIPADVVAALGNGSTKAGSDKLYEMMHNIRRHHRSTGPKDLPPPAKSPLEYIKRRSNR